MRIEATAVPADGEKRASRRFEPADANARIAWREGGHIMRSSHARLADIGDQGAMILVGVPIHEDRDVWIGLQSLRGEWVRASIREIRSFGERWALHISFREPCPPGLLEQAEFGGLAGVFAWYDISCDLPFELP